MKNGRPSVPPRDLEQLAARDEGDLLVIVELVGADAGPGVSTESIE